LGDLAAAVCGGTKVRPSIGEGAVASKSGSPKFLVVFGCPAGGLSPDRFKNWLSRPKEFVAGTLETLSVSLESVFSSDRVSGLDSSCCLMSITKSATVERGWFADMSIEGDVEDCDRG
jgi:hypothetical protein